MPVDNLWTTRRSKIIVVEGSKIMDTAFVLTDLMFDHEDVTCG